MIAADAVSAGAVHSFARQVPKAFTEVQLGIAFELEAMAAWHFVIQAGVVSAKAEPTRPRTAKLKIGSFIVSSTRSERLLIVYLVA